MCMCCIIAIIVMNGYAHATNYNVGLHEVDNRSEKIQSIYTYTHIAYAIANHWKYDTDWANWMKYYIYKFVNSTEFGNRNWNRKRREGRDGKVCTVLCSRVFVTFNTRPCNGQKKGAGYTCSMLHAANDRKWASHNTHANVKSNGQIKRKSIFDIFSLFTPFFFSLSSATHKPYVVAATAAANRQDDTVCWPLHFVHACVHVSGQRMSMRLFRTSRTHSNTQTPFHYFREFER